MNKNRGMYYFLFKALTMMQQCGAEVIWRNWSTMKQSIYHQPTTSVLSFTALEMIFLVSVKLWWSPTHQMALWPLRKKSTIIGKRLVKQEWHFNTFQCDQISPFKLSCYSRAKTKHQREEECSLIYAIPSIFAIPSVGFLLIE